MEVSHASSETQSASIGIKGKASEVRVTTDAEFMMSLAHGIYSNKPLALIREITCNARDGHNLIGTPDAVIDFTLTDNLLVIRDYGPGIPNDRFADLYMTFGESTKRKDKNQTGGFGVGAKVPWAVCDTFSARNFRDGHMTAYSITKSNPDLDGKPSCTAIMTIPSKEPSGIEVSIPFPERMHDEIKLTLGTYVRELGIPARLNGTTITQTYLDKIQELNQYGFATFDAHPNSVNQHCPFYLRLGDVMYPIDHQEEYNDAYNLLQALVERGKPIVFLGEPDKVVPTMSRESLSYTEQTLQSIKKYLINALQSLADKIDDFALNLQPWFIEEYVKNQDFEDKMWRYEKAFPNFLAHYDLFRLEHLFTPDTSKSQKELIRYNAILWLKKSAKYIETKQTTGVDVYNSINSEVTKHFISYLGQFPYMNHDNLIQVWYSRSKHIKSFVDLEKSLNRNSYEELFFWDREVKAYPEISDVVFYKGSSDLRYVMDSNKNDGYFLSVVNLKDLHSKKEKILQYNETLSEGLFVSNLVILAPVNFRQFSLRNREMFRGKDKIWKTPFSSCHANIYGARIVRLKATCKSEDIERFKLEYEKQGYRVVSLWEPTAEEIAEREALAAERAALKDIPLPTLGEMIKEKLPTYPLDLAKKNRKHLRHLLSNPAFKGKPLYLIGLRGKDLHYELSSLQKFITLVKFVGTDIVVVSTKTEIAKVIKEGRQSVEDVLVEFAKRFFSSYEMHEKLFYHNTSLAKRGEQNKYLTKLFFNRIPPVFTKQEKEIYAALIAFQPAFPKLSRYLSGGTDPETGLETKGKFWAYRFCAPEHHYKTLFETYAFTHFCDVPRALDFAYKKRPSPRRALARSIIKNILKAPPINDESDD